MEGDKKRTLAERLYNANVLTDASLKSADLIDVTIENIKENGTGNQNDVEEDIKEDEEQ